MVHDDMTRRGMALRKRGVAHASRSVMPGRMRTMLRGFRRGGLLMGRSLAMLPAAVSAVRRGEGRSAERNARETGNHEILDVLVHVTPLSTFFFDVLRKTFSRLHQVRKPQLRFLTEN